MPYESHGTGSALFRRHRQLQDIRELQKVMYVKVVTLNTDINMVYRPRCRYDKLKTNRTKGNEQLTNDGKDEIIYVLNVNEIKR
jgi:hypothetical protein